ncbi:ninein isoform X9 [Paroedura picta]|uniref:ninein isoform X9 n=1 Tax=Paroedura picta TaxID=143630 RepID=UPI0040574298
MDEAEQDQYEARLKELFDSFDLTGSGSLGREELTDLCHVLHLEEVAPGALQQTLLQDSLLERVNFDQFKEALILVLSRTLTNEEPFEEPDSSPEAQPKYIKGGKRYGRRSLPEFQEPSEDFAKVTLIEPLHEETQPPRLPSDACDEPWQSQDSEEYEAEGQLRFWNPDDLNAPPNISPTQDWIEEKLREVCENLGISRDGHLNREKLVSICEQYGLQNIDTQMLEEVFHNLQHDGLMSIEDFFYGLFKIGKPLPTSASTPYRQLKRHLSMQSFDESGRRNTTTSAMTTTISFRVFSNLDDGMGQAAVDEILDAWHEEGIENSHEILKALDFSLDGKVNLSELTLALENELLITKNGIYQAALASFKTEIRHLMARVDQVVREKAKLRLDLEKAEKLKSLMASEVDDHHAAIERQNEYNLRKLDEEYKDRVAVLRNELRKEREQILQQAGKQRAELEQEIETLKMEENYLRDRLALTLKENSRLESELLEMGEKLAKYESTTSKLQKNLENVLAEKFGDLDPGSAELFWQEERMTQMRIECERQCRELQDRIDELQSQLEVHRSPGKAVRRSLKSSLYEELGNSGMESHHEVGSEECNPLTMSIEAEMVIEQMKDQHHRDLCDLQQQLENTVHRYEKQLEETQSRCEEEKGHLQQKFCQEMISRQQHVDDLQAQVSDLRAELAQYGQRASPGPREVQLAVEEADSSLEGLRRHSGGELQARLAETCESFSREREELIQAGVWMEAKMRSLARTAQEEKAELEHGFCEQLQLLAEKHALETEQIRRALAEKHREELQQERQKVEAAQKEKAAAQKMAENLKKQVSELKAWNQQLEAENTSLGRKNSSSPADAQDLDQQLMRVLWQRESASGKCEPEEWERECSPFKEELENCKIQSSTLVSSLEAELCQLRSQACAVEEENLCLKQELEKVQQVPRSDLQNEISSLIVKNEQLMKEKEALSEELDRTAEKVAKAAFFENLAAALKQEKGSWEHQMPSLRAQTAAAQDKVSKLKSDLRVTQQENDALKQEVMSLHKQLQAANDKIRTLGPAAHPAGLQSQQKKLCWEELDQLVKQEQQLLRQENDRLQRDVQNAKAELAHSREKIQQLEASHLSVKHPKHQSPSGITKATEQEKLKTECELLHKELISASRKVSQMKHELETVKLENEDLRKKQAKLDEQLMERLHSSASVRLNQSPHPRNLQPHQAQGCAVVPWEQHQQLRHQLFQAERRSQRLQEELENRSLDTNMPQSGHEELLKTMEKRMMDVEQQLRLVKRLLQDKVNQLKEQVVKNTRADEMVKDLYVENAQLLKALEMTEQRQKTVEKKNYLLEEKIANLGRIVKNLTSPALGSAAHLGS